MGACHFTGVLSLTRAAHLLIDHNDARGRYAAVRRRTCSRQGFPFWQCAYIVYPRMGLGRQTSRGYSIAVAGMRMTAL